MAAVLLSARGAAALLALAVLGACAAAPPRHDARPRRARAVPDERSAAPVDVARARPPEPTRPPAEAVPVPGDDDGPLTAKIDRDTPPRRAAALRLTEQARPLLVGDESARAIELLERAVAVDARAPYAYYFLAEAHADAGHWALARSFVARAQQLFAADPYWLGRVHALHGRIAEEEGRLDEARDAYTRALAAWPRNGDAANALARLDASGQGAR